MKVICVHLFTSLCFALPVWSDAVRIGQYKDELRAVRPPELAAETARLISERNADAADAVSAAITLHGPAATFVVGAVAKRSPTVAPVAAAAAIALQPNLAGPIAKAAVSAAPSEIAAVVTASCQALPSSFYAIGIGAAQAAPKSSDEIIPAIVAAIPVLKPVFERARRDFRAAHRAASLALLLKHAQNIVATLANAQNVLPEVVLKESEAAMAARLATATLGPPPVQLPPFVGGGIPTEIPASTTAESAGCQCYSAP